jgi:hypothetical protein
MSKLPRYHGIRKIILCGYPHYHTCTKGFFLFLKLIIFKKLTGEISSKGKIKIFETKKSDLVFKGINYEIHIYFGFHCCESKHIEG